MIPFIFESFPKIARMKREVVITEKLDGTNAQVAIFDVSDPDHLAAAKANPHCLSLTHSKANGDSPTALFVGSRSRWIAPEGTPGLDKGCDNFGFARWVRDNLAEIEKLGVGQHFGEWYGAGIQRNYGLNEKRWALFNTARWGTHNPNTPACCEVVTRLNEGLLEKATIDDCMNYLREFGSQHVVGWQDPEGVVMYHSASRTLYKQTFKNDSGKHAE